MKISSMMLYFPAMFTRGTSERARITVNAKPSKSGTALMREIEKREAEKKTRGRAEGEKGHGE